MRLIERWPIGQEFTYKSHYGYSIVKCVVKTVSFSERGEAAYKMFKNGLVPNSVISSNGVKFDLKEIEFTKTYKQLEREEKINKILN